MNTHVLIHRACLMRSYAYVCVVVMMLCSVTQVGCAASLGDTSYPVLSPDGVEGLWAASYYNSETWVDFEGVVRIERVVGGSPRDALVVLLKKQQVQDEQRYRVGFYSLEHDGEPLWLVGKFLQTSREVFFTFQGDTGATGWPFNVLTTPLQYTMRVDFDQEDSAIVLLAHEHLLVRIPIQSQPSCDCGHAIDGNGVVDDLDAIVKHYARARDDEWREVMRFRRLSEVVPDERAEAP